MEIKKIIYPKENENYNNELIVKENLGIKTIFGAVSLKKGTRIPNSGYSRHPFNEISIITKGCIEMIDENNQVIGYLKAGDVVYINAFEPQAGNIIEETKLVYVISQPIDN